MVWEGLNVVKTGRVMLGETNPRDSAPGTIRGDFCVDIGRNIIHGSDSVESAEKEIGLWFTASELVSWRPAAITWVYEDEEEEEVGNGVADGVKVWRVTRLRVVRLLSLTWVSVAQDEVEADFLEV